MPADVFIDNSQEISAAMLIRETTKLLDDVLIIHDKLYVQTAAGSIIQSEKLISLPHQFY